MAATPASEDTSSSGTHQRCGPVPKALKKSHKQAIRSWVPIELLFTVSDLDENEAERLAWLAHYEDAKTRLDAGEELPLPLVTWRENEREFVIVHGEDVVAAVAEWSRPYQLRMMEVAIQYPDPRPVLPKMTPTQDLIVEVLAARERSGDFLFTFDARTRSAAEDLAAKGVLIVLDGVVERTYRAGLTWEGRFAALHPGYRSHQQMMLDDRAEQIETFSKVIEMHRQRRERDAERAAALKKTYEPGRSPRQPWMRGTL